jgi:hypothetical protein
MDLKEITCEDMGWMAQDRDQMLPLMNMAMRFRGYKKDGEFFD